MGPTFTPENRSSLLPGVKATGSIGGCTIGLSSFCSVLVLIPKNRAIVLNQLGVFLTSSTDGGDFSTSLSGLFIVFNSLVSCDIIPVPCSILFNSRVTCDIIDRK